jgi:hypothetical protein
VIVLQPKNYDRHIRSSDTYCINRMKKKCRNVKKKLDENDEHCYTDEKNMKYRNTINVRTQQMNIRVDCKLVVLPQSVTVIFLRFIYSIIATIPVKKNLYKTAFKRQL